MRPKIIGLVHAWYRDYFIEPAIKQALKYCDDVVVCIAPCSAELAKFVDDTRKIAERYRGKVKWVEHNEYSTVDEQKPKVMNKMLNASGL